ncbi:MAG TPA: nucleotide exchange factor GrpE [Acidothermaceae bacterium]|nr:nucleotide exchange factor GrpE [Acidothermaceae bacterium]
MSGPDPFDQPIVRDKRRVHFDPASGAVSHDPRPNQSNEGPASAGPSDPGSRGGVDSIELSQLRTEVAERTADLQRLQAEYANYRKRVERDREAVREFAVGEALAALLPVLDDIGRAREHGELEGGFRQVAEALDAAVVKLGLTRFGQPGDPFDPTQHDALMHAYSDEVTEPTAVQILQPGYSYAGRVIRPARVAVAEPTVALPVDETAAEPSDQ